MERREQEELQREREIKEEQQRRLAKSTDMDVTYESTLSPEELREIRLRHMGGAEKRVKKLKRHGDRRNLFEWDAEDDTGTPAAFLATAGRGFSSSQQRGNRFDIEADSVTDVHWSKKPAAKMRDRDWRILREDFNISTQGGAVPNPIRYWEEEEETLGSRLVSIIARLGFENPTPIQRQAIPIALQKRDMIGIAETGSGKTLAFLLPMLAHILNLPRMTSDTALEGPYGLILAPTRELAQQIENEAKKFCEALGFRSVAIVGGHSVSEQSVHLRRGVEIVVATPGRLRDCLEQHVLVLNQCYAVVLDEADRMVDLNYEEDLTYIFHALPTATEKPEAIAENPSLLSRGRYRQTTMYSATMQPAVERLARLYLRRPAVVTVGEVGTAVDRINQEVIMIGEHEKLTRLSNYLGQFKPPIIIFVNQKTTADLIFNRLKSYGNSTIVLHGGKSQVQREEAIEQLKSGRKDVLIATDVAGRGIDIPDVSLVLNYDMAKTIDDYVHRIGRTGRAGKQGTAITFITDKDTDVYYDLRLMLQKSKNAVVPPEFANHEAARKKPGAVTQKRRHEEKIFAYGL